MHRLLFSFGLIAVGLLPNFGQEEVQLDHPARPVVEELNTIENPDPLRKKELIVSGPKITFASLSVQSVDGPEVTKPETLTKAVTENCECENCECENCECAEKPKSGWQPLSDTTSVYSSTASSAGSYAASSAGSYGAKQTYTSSAGSYAASSAGSYGARHSVSLRRPFAGIRARMYARRSARQSRRHGRQSARHQVGYAISAPASGVCSSCQ